MVVAHTKHCWMTLQIVKQWIAKDLEGISCCLILCTYLLTPWCRVLEKLTDFQLLKKFPTFYGTRKFIIAFTSARHLPLSWARSIQSIPHIRLLILFSHICLGLPSGLFPSGFPTKTLYTSLLSSIRAACHNPRYCLGKDLEGQRKTTINLS